MTTQIRTFSRSAILSAKNLIISGMFLTGLILGVLSIDIYRDTVIPVNQVIVSIACSSVFGLLILFLMFRSEKLWYLVAVSASFFGGVVMFVTLFVNREFRHSERILGQFDIVKRGSMSRSKSGCRQPLIGISFYGQDKELVMYCQDELSAATAQKVQLVYAEGFFGYPYILSKKLLD